MNQLDLVTAEGAAILHELRGVTYTDEASGEQYWIGAARDITERVEREPIPRRASRIEAAFDMQ